MLLAGLAVLGGLILLVISADRFVFGASGLALNFGRFTTDDWFNNCCLWHIGARDFCLCRRRTAK